MSFISKRESRKGMTLIELLVVIALISIITGVTWINFRYFGKYFDTERDVNKMAQELRSLLERTMAMESFEVPEACAGDKTIVAYGAYLESGRNYYDKVAYIINNDDTHGFGSIICVEIMESIPLEHGNISLIEVEFGVSRASVPGVDIIFVPPHPRTYIGGIDVYTVNDETKWRSYYDQVEIFITLEGEDTKSIKVNKAGLIEVVQPAS